MKFYSIIYREKGNTDSGLREQIISAHTLNSAKEIFKGVINKEKRFTIVKAKESK